MDAGPRCALVTGRPVPTGGLTRNCSKWNILGAGQGRIQVLECLQFIQLGGSFKKKEYKVTDTKVGPGLGRGLCLLLSCLWREPQMAQGSPLLRFPPDSPESPGWLGPAVGEGAEGCQDQAGCRSPGVPGAACHLNTGWAGAEAWVWAGGEEQGSR